MKNKEIIYYAESFTLQLFLKIFFSRNIYRVFLKDSVSFFNDNVYKKNFFELIVNKIFPSVQVIRFPKYRFNEQELGKEGLCYKANCLTLEFIETETFKKKLDIILNASKESAKNESMSIAFKKKYLEVIFQKILFYLIFDDLKRKFEIDQIFINSNDIFEIYKYINIEKINQNYSVKSNYLQNFFGYLFYSLNPYLMRVILKRGVNFFKIKRKKFLFGIQMVWGFPPNVPGMNIDDFSNIVTDDELLKSKRIDKSDVVFLNGKKFGRKSDTKSEEEQKKYIKNLGSSMEDENKFKIPISIFIKDIIFYILKNIILLKLLKKNYFGDLSTEKILQKIHSEYIENKITTEYLEIKIFFSRDDYDSSHITRTFTQNQKGNLNVGIQHSAFSKPQILPLQAFNYFDIYFTQGKEFEKLWYPYWNLNKQNIAAGTQRAHLINKSKITSNKIKKFNNKYTNKINILLLIGSTTSIHTPKWLYKMKYEKLNEILLLDKKINIILKPRFKDDARDLFEIHPKLKKYFNSRIFIEDEDFTTQELISLVDILIAEDNSSAILEAIHKEDLLTVGYRIRYPHQDELNLLIMNNFNDLKLIISSFVESGKLNQNYILDRNIIKEKYSLDSKRSNWYRISDYFADISS